MVAGKKGRKSLGKSKDYYKGYHTGFQRVARKKNGMDVALTKKVDSKRSSDWQDGLREGARAGYRYYFPHRR